MKLDIKILRQGSVVIDSADIEESEIELLTDKFAVLTICTSTKRGDIIGFGHTVPDTEGHGPKVTLNIN